jgi:hypothetical protein
LGYFTRGAGAVHEPPWEKVIDDKDILPKTRDLRLIIKLLKVRDRTQRVHLRVPDLVTGVPPP